jgi:hypothetical protein
VGGVRPPSLFDPYRMALLRLDPAAGNSRGAGAAEGTCARGTAAGGSGSRHGLDGRDPAVGGITALRERAAHYGGIAASSEGHRFRDEGGRGSFREGGQRSGDDLVDLDDSLVEKPLRNGESPARGRCEGHGEVYLPHALARIYPEAGREWGWQYVFPACHLDVGVEIQPGDVPPGHSPVP